MTIHTPEHNLLKADQERAAIQKAARLQKAKLALALSSASVSVLFAVLQLPRLATTSFARMDSSATLHRPPPFASTGSNGETVGTGNVFPSKEQVLGVSTTNKAPLT